MVLIVVVSALAAMAFDNGAERRAAVNVSIAQADGGGVDIIYDLERPVRALAFRAIAGGYRERRWAAASPDFTIRRGEDLDFIERRDGRAFDTVAVTAQPNLVRIQKSYQPLAAYGDGGLLVYTGHFWPVIDDDRRMDAAFSFSPAPGAQVVAFGEHVDVLQDWRSPMAHPAFVYLGPLEPVESQEVLALVDPTAPDWIRDEFAALTPAAFELLSQQFGFDLSAKPNLFMAAPLSGDPGRLSYSGDALPGQFQITLEGGGWRARSERAVSIFRRATIHEAVHLWQAAARPSAQEEAPWIHEGAADAIAAEAMVTLGLWDGADYETHLRETRADCAARLRDGPLAGAGARRDFGALYACGHIIAAAVSRADGAPASAFWRAFVADARKRDAGYTEKHYFDLVAERTGDPAFERALRAFVRTPLADPEREIDRLFEAARGS